MSILDEFNEKMRKSELCKDAVFINSKIKSRIKKGEIYFDRKKLDQALDLIINQYGSLEQFCQIKKLNYDEFQAVKLKKMPFINQKYYQAILSVKDIRKDVQI